MMGYIMSRRSSKRNKACDKLKIANKITFKNAVKLLRDAPLTKFDQSVDVSINTSVDTKQSDQIVREMLQHYHTAQEKKYAY